MRATEMRQLSPEELTQRLDDSKDDLFRLRFQLISGQLQNYRRMREARREIARIKTIIRGRELEINQAPTEATADVGSPTTRKRKESEEGASAEE